MLSNLLRRGEELALAEQRKTVAEIAARLRETIRGASIEVEEARILVSGRGMLKRWLIDPSLRFLTGGLK